MRKIAIVSLLAAGSAFASSIAIGGDPRVDPSRFRITEFATGLNSPYGMQMLGDGSLLVGVSQGFFGTPGNLVRFTDTNHDGIADGPGTLVFSNLPRIMTSVRRAGDLVLTMSDNGGQPVISVLRPGANPTAT
ncbi:MAG: hypothetical protein EXQ52_17430, partial [Bryobacterales bacterium]|nr:hypothetical protein [Bryobacterales bacterium]